MNPSRLAMPKRNRPRGKIRGNTGGEPCEICGDPSKYIAGTRTKAGVVSFPACSEECAEEETFRLANLPDIGMETEEQIAALPDTIATVLSEVEAKQQFEQEQRNENKQKE